MDGFALPRTTIDWLRIAGQVSATARSRAAALDRAGAFPVEDVAQLGETGLLGCVLPVSLGGAVTEDAAGGLFMLRLLHVVGQGSLALGRLFEAHVNALRLVVRFGTQAQRQVVAQDVQAGRLFALWVTDGPSDGLRMSREGDRIRLSGGKGVCSGAGHADCAIVTAATPEGGAHMLLITMGRGERCLPRPSGLQGMRASITGAMDFSGCTLAPEAELGAEGDYLREPEFSTGAWRSSAVALGGLACLLAIARSQLVDLRRDTNPHQRARMGRAMIAHHTGWLWMERAAQMVQQDAAEAGELVAYVNLARIAVETCCLEAITLVQRSLGLSAFVQANPVEQLCRDLATYLRQPAPDEVLDEAAAWFMARPVPFEPA